MGAAAVGVLALLWTWGHPTAFEPYSTSKVWTNRAHVGQTVYVGMTFEGLADTRQVKQQAPPGGSGAGHAR